jgi:hypothetical protein
VARKVDLKAKAKKQKILAAVLGVIFLGVAGFMGPKTLKQLTGPKVDPLRAQQEAAAASTTSSVPLAPPSLGGTTPSAAASSSGGTPQLAAVGSTQNASLDQLTSFSRFSSKDPFIQQVTPNGTGGSSGSAPTATTPSSGGGSTPTSPSPSSQPPAPKPAPQPKPPPVKPTAAVISVNNLPAQVVQPGQDFPLAPYEAIFHLVSLGQSSVRIAIAGGSYTSGAASVTLKKGKSLTLENTADGTRYVVKLLWVGAGAPPAGLIPPAAGTTTTSSAPAATTTTTP